MNDSDTSLDENQKMLADSARKYLERGYASGATIAPPDGCSPEHWREFSELGWLALPVPEKYNGLGGSLSDVCVLAEQLGRSLVQEPLLAATVLSGMLLADAAPPEVAQQWLPFLADGTKRVAFAPWEPNARHDFLFVAMTARLDDGQWRLEGEKGLAPGAGGADAFIVAVRSDGGNLGLFLVDSGLPGVHVYNRVLYDGRYAATLRFSGAGPAILLMEGSEEKILLLISQAMDRAVIAHAAETIGTMARAFEITCDYLGMRKQFGKPIVANQVIQHRLVDLYVEVEEARALTRAAALSPSPRMASAAVAFTSQVARHMWEEAIQLHGAIGMTEECAIGAYVRRLALATSLYGDAHFHLERLAAISLDEKAVAARCVFTK